METNPQLDELIQLQKEQNQLLRKNLMRIKFSLWALLVMMTGICLVFGAIVFFASSVVGPAAPARAGATLNITGGELSIEGTSAPATTTDGDSQVFYSQDKLRLGTQSAPTDAPQFNLEPAQPDTNNDLFDTVIGEKK